MEHSKFTFLEPQLLESSFEVNNNFKETTEQIELSTHFSLDVNVNKEEKFADIVMTVTVGKQEDAPPFFVKVAMGAKFSWKKEKLSEKELKSFIHCNAPALLIGYIRPVVVFLTSQSPYPPYHIPFVDFTSNGETEQKA